MLNLKPQVLDYVLTINGFVNSKLINLINDQIYLKEKENWSAGNIHGGLKNPNGLLDGRVRSVDIRGLTEPDIGFSVTKRIIYNELKILTSKIENIYKEKVSSFYFSHDNYFQFLYYNDKMRGHYEYHTDHSKETPRNLTILIGLNDKKEYEGGKLCVHNHDGVILDKGDVIIFPSNFMFPHKVEPVTKGERKVLVIWTQ